MFWTLEAPRTVLSSVAATSHMWLFKFESKLIKIK